MAQKEANKMTLYIDMDNVLVDFQSGIDRLSEQQLCEYQGRYDEVEGIFGWMDPMDGAVAAVAELAQHFDLYILSTAPWNNPSAWSDKLKWVQEKWGTDSSSPVHKRLILSHHKDLNVGSILVDDRDQHNGVPFFSGVHLHFGKEGFRNWEETKAFLLALVKPVHADA
jgi:hypothetical protein